MMALDASNEQIKNTIQ